MTRQPTLDQISIRALKYVALPLLILSLLQVFVQGELAGVDRMEAEMVAAKLATQIHQHKIRSHKNTDSFHSQIEASGKDWLTEAMDVKPVYVWKKGVLYAQK